ncbi:hypothetical protein ATCC90586_010036 [Pythium insidiosum]|nr:hypothetical protein ATCC90586_010036 [Pythium insidiosum]
MEGQQSAPVMPLSLSLPLSRSSSLNGTTGSSRMTLPQSPTSAAGDRFKLYDEHVVALEELERRFDTNRLSGLLAHVVARIQGDDGGRLNLLPTDEEIGHGNIHELVAVLRDGSWIHTRAENLLPGDVISLAEGQCVPADVRLFECDNMFVDQSPLTGPRAPEPRDAVSTSVFDAAHATVPYLAATNMAFYGTTVTRGSGKAIVVRTGRETVLGGIAAKVLQTKRTLSKHRDVPFTDEMRQICPFVKEAPMPSAIQRVSTLVVEYSDVVSRTVAAASFGASPPVIVEPEDLLDASHRTADELERQIAECIMTHAENDVDAMLFMKALAACRRRVDSSLLPSSSTADAIDPLAGPSMQRVPTLPPSSPLAPLPVVDPVRDEDALLRFSSLFGSASPKNSMHKKTRCSTLLHGQISGCQVSVHFDQEKGSHVVLLQGPAREILSRCGHVRRAELDALGVLETQDLEQLEAMVLDLETRAHTVVSFAELYLDPSKFPVDFNFDIENFNFPTSQMCYLGSLGLLDKVHPEIVGMQSFARSADVRLLIASTALAFPRNGAVLPSEGESDSDATSSGSEQDQSAELGGAHVPSICKVPMQFREASSSEILEVEAVVYPSRVLSISNTLNQWKELLLEHSIVVFDGCDPAHIDLLVETLQELGECVGLVASGSANALALATADVSFSVPSLDEVVDLGRDAADVHLWASSFAHSYAIRLIESVKTRGRGKAPHRADSKRGVSATVSSREMATITNLFRESLAVAQLLGLRDTDVRACFEAALTGHGEDLPTSPSPSPTSRIRPVNPLWTPPSPSKLPPSAFWNTPFAVSSNSNVGAAALSAGIAGVGPRAASQRQCL